MRVNNAVRVGAVGSLDCIHVTSDWLTAALQACGAAWSHTYASSLASAVLMIATWCVVPHVFLWLTQLLKVSIAAHSIVTYAFLRVTLVVARSIVMFFWMLELYLASRITANLPSNSGKVGRRINES
jgi:hypothetical protein